MRRTIAVALSLFALATGPAFAIPEGPPGSTTGDDASSFTGLAPAPDAQLFTGAAVTSIPIELPPGRREMKPNLAFAYSSQGGHGMLGMGWDLPLGRIERSTRLGVPGYHAGDAFVAILPDGAIELARLSDGTYAARIDESHVRVTADTASNRWQLHDKSGRDYFFGTTTASRVGPFPTDFATTFAWHLTQIRDPNGNTIDISYETHADALGPTGHAYPVRIRYGGAAGLAHLFSIDLLWAPRFQAHRVSYAAGYRVVYDRYLPFVQVSYIGANSPYTGTIFRRYSFDWQASSTSGAPLLRAVTLYGADNTLLTNEDGTPASTTFTYHEAPVLPFTAVPLTTDLLVNSFRDGGDCTTRDFLDLNGDGRPDLVRTGTWTSDDPYWQVHFNRGPTAVPMLDPQATPWRAALSCIEKRNRADEPGRSSRWTRWATFDVDGDGRPDLVDAQPTIQSSRWDVYLNVGDGFAAAPTSWVLPSCLPAFNNCWSALRHGDVTQNNDFVYRDSLDLNGDGRPEHIVTASHGGPPNTWLVWWNTGYDPTAGAGWFSLPEYVPAPHPWIRNGGPDTDHRTIKSDLFDLNGDGLPDKVAARGTHWDVWYGRGRSFEPQPVAWNTPPRPFLRAWDEDQEEYLYDLLDVNGDGLPDFVDAGGWSTDNLFWQVSVNRGQGFATPAPWPAHAKLRKKHPGEGVGNALHIDTFDIDGNGYPDSIRLPGTAGTTAQIWSGHPVPARSDTLATVSTNPAHRTIISYDVFAPLPLDPVDPALNAGPGHHLPFPTWVVREIRAEDVTGPGDVLTSYRYGGGYFDGARREFRGFGLAIATDFYGASRLTRFHQTDALRGKPSEEATTARDPLGPTPGYLTRTVTTWDVVPVGGRQAVRLRTRERTDHSSTTDVPWNDGPAFRRATTTYTYDACGNLTREQVHEVLPGGPVLRADSSVTFDGLNGGCNAQAVCVGICDRASTMGIFGGASKTLAYDTRGNLTQTVLLGPGNPTTTMTYDAWGNLERITEPEGATTDFTHAGGGDFIHPTRIIREAPGLTQQVRTFDYDERFGKVTLERGNNSEITRTEYDAFGRVSRVATEGRTLANPTRTFTYLLGAQPRVEIRTLEPNHPDGYRAEVAFADPLGRPLQRQVQRNVNGTLRTVVLGAVERELGGRVRKEFAPYTGFSPPTERIVVASNHAATELTYDQFGRVIARRLPDGVILRSSFATAWVRRSCDGRHGENPGTGSCTEEEVDAVGRLRFRRTFTGASTTPYAFEERRYDSAGQLIRVEQNNGVGTRISYDTLGRRIRVIDPDSGEWRFGYDRNGNVVYVDDPVNGRHLEFTYDAFNRLVRRSMRASDTQGAGVATVLAEYVYDTGAIAGQGRLTRVVDASGETRIEAYDHASGQVARATKTITFGGVTKTFTTRNTFDALGRLIRTNVPYPTSGEESVDFKYDAGGLPIRLSTPTGTYVTRVLYDELQQPLSVDYGNRAVDLYTYGNAADRHRLRHIRTGAGGQVRGIGYEYDANDNVTAVTDVEDEPYNFAQTAEYDALSRLTRSTQTGYTGTFTYDALGNLLSKDGKSYFYGAGGPHQPGAVGGEGILYDDNGNMTTLPGGRTLTFDAEGRLTEVKRNGVTIARYLYDHAGERVAAQTLDSTTFFFPGFDVRGNTVIRHFRLGERLVASSPVSGGDMLTASAGQTARTIVVARALVTGSTIVLLGVALVLPGRRRGLPLAVATFFLAAQLPLPQAAHAQCEEDIPPPPGTIFYHPDHLGTPQLISDGDTWLPAEYFLTRPYGESGGLFDRFGTPLAESRAAFRFTGHRFEDDTGLVYMGARYYDPALGLFVSHDPAAQFFSPYSYGGGNPLNGRDPNGALFGIDDALLGALILAGGIIAAGVQTAINGGSFRDVTRAMGNALTTGVISAGATGLVGGAVATLGPTASLTCRVALVGFGTYGTVRSFESEQYAVGSAALVAAANGIAGIGGTLGSDGYAFLNESGGVSSTASVWPIAPLTKVLSGLVDAVAYVVKIQALDTYALAVGAAGKETTVRMDVSSFLATLAAGDYAGAALGLAKTFIHLVFPFYGRYGGAGYGVRQHGTSGKPPPLNQVDYGNFVHDQATGNHWVWISTVWWGPGLQPGIFGNIYRVLGTVPFAVAGAVQQL